MRQTKWTLLDDPSPAPAPVMNGTWSVYISLDYSPPPTHYYHYLDYYSYYYLYLLFPLLFLCFSPLLSSLLLLLLFLLFYFYESYCWHYFPVTPLLVYLPLPAPTPPPPFLLSSEPQLPVQCILQCFVPLCCPEALFFHAYCWYTILFNLVHFVICGYIISAIFAPLFPCLFYYYCCYYHCFLCYFFIFLILVF